MQVKVIKGTKQIGGCITEIATDKTRIIIDFGQDLTDESTEYEVKGLTTGEAMYDAVFITHSHGDHIGLINKILDDIPIYVEEKSLNIHNITCDFCGYERISRYVNVFKLNKWKQTTIEVGDIHITPYRTDHSSYNSCMFLIEAEGKKILHTGDFRMHGRKSEEAKFNLEKIGKVNLLITEGTTLSRKTYEYVSEIDLEKEITKYMNEYNQVFVMQSSTNIDRTVSFVKSALSVDKKYVLDLFSYSINKALNANINVDFKNVFVWQPLRYKKDKPQYFKQKYMDFEPSSKFGKNYAMNVKQSMLEDIELLNSKGLITKACLIYSMWDGYLIKEEKLREFITKLESMGIKFIALHTSGHADIKSMENLNKIVNPDNTIIIHTENSESGTGVFNNVHQLFDNDVFFV